MILISNIINKWLNMDMALNVKYLSHGLFTSAVNTFSDITCLFNHNHMQSIHDGYSYRVGNIICLSTCIRFRSMMLNNAETLLQCDFINSLSKKPQPWVLIPAHHHPKSIFYMNKSYSTSYMDNSILTCSRTKECGIV